MIHSLLIIGSESGSVLYSAHYLLPPGHAQEAFLTSLLAHTEGYWSRTTQASTKVTITINDVTHVVFQRCNELLVFICGQDDCDELVLAELLDVLALVLSDLTNKSNSENVLMTADVHGKLAVSLDEMIPAGIIENLDAESILLLAKLKA